jgi:hypothetical protein
MNCLIPAAGNGLPDVRGGIRVGVAGGVLLSIALLTPGWDLPVAAADPGTPVVNNCSQPPQVKPEHIILTCADATLAVDKIVWNSWTVDSATGHGVEFQDDCVPNCAQGSATYSPVTITLNGATPPDFRYTSAVVTNQNTGRSDTWPMS